MELAFFQVNLYSGLLLVGWVQGSVYAVLLFLRAGRERRISDAFAASILVVSSLYVAQWMFGFAGWYDAHDWRTTCMFYVPWDQLLLLGPLIWLYFRAATNGGFRWKGSMFWHFLPAMFTVLPYLAAFGYDLVYLSGVKGQPLNYFFGTRGPMRENSWLFGPVVASGLATAAYLQLTAYLIFTARGYRHYRNYLKEAFSDSNGRSFAGLGTLLMILVVGIVLTMLTAVYQSQYGEAAYVREWFHHLTLSIVVFAAGIQFLQVDGDRIAVLRYEPPRPEPSRVPPASSLSVWDLTQARMERHRDYLEPDLKLADLAQRIAVQDKQLSAAINACSGLNFNDYINGLRCAYFIGLLEREEHRQRTLLRLALDSGFNSKSTFNRAFRKCYACSPGEALAQLRSGQSLTQKMI
ncbi:AraC-like DNA-binding protein [Neolewinella xylanilytica]|uniref:AraC-like DNA-binding protein n=1 Tax=Neolewinella xylanilytica TaxID=1514080 RepID=A0A2S6I560_9BACT|nr:AraC family transcriptional regulator [Neolewinella xylanilytica]PPK86280.1 AraC-like DNA-binding protein [Neolewinella xylanilytica]